MAEESGDRSVSRRTAAGAKEAPLQAARGGRKADLGTRTGHHARERAGALPPRKPSVSPDASAFSGQTLEVRNGEGWDSAASWTRGRRSRRKFGIGMPAVPPHPGSFPHEGGGWWRSRSSQQKLLREKEAPGLPHKGEVGKLVLSCKVRSFSAPFAFGWVADSSSFPPPRPFWVSGREENSKRDTRGCSLARSFCPAAAIS